MIQELLSRRGFTLKNLHLLLELEEAGSLVKVAKGNETRQGLYSRQLRELSECFGVALTERQGRELKLTEHGRRLARLVRETFLNMGNFQHSCGEEQLAVSIGAGDSLLQWLLLPRLGTIQDKLKKLHLNVHFTLLNLKNDEIAEKLAELKLDFGVMRDTAVPPKHRKERLLLGEFAIFVPKSLLPRSGKADYKRVFQSIPLVRHSPGGELVTHIAQMALAEKIALNYCLTCEGFPQACRAIQSGRYAGILPTIARGDLKAGDYVEVDWPALKAEARSIMLAYNRRRLSLRTDLEKVANCLKAELARAA